MKLTHLLLCAVLSFVSLSVYSKSYSVSPEQVEAIQERLDYEVQKMEKLENGKVVADILRQVSLSIEAVEEGEELKEKERKLTGKEKIGKVAAAITTTTIRPFMYAGSFVKGLVQKEDKHKEELFIERFYLAHRAEFDDIAFNQNAKELDEFIETMTDKFEDLYAEYYQKDAQNFLKEMMTIAQEEGLNAITAERINSAESFQSIKKILGPVDWMQVKEWKKALTQKAADGELTEQEAIDVLSSDILSNDTDNLLKLFGHETIGALVGQLVAGPLVISILSKVLAWSAVPVLLASDIITYTSVKSCLKEQKKDTAMIRYCGQILNKNGYLIVRSRVRGHTAGNKFQRTLKKVFGKKKKKASGI